MLVMLMQLMVKTSDITKYMNKIWQVLYMKIFKNILVNIKMIFSSYGIYICMLFTVILCFGSGIYVDAASSNDYSAINSLLTFNRDYMINNIEFCSFNVSTKVLNGWITMFVPVIASFAYIPIVCDEFESKAVRLNIFRTSKSSYYSSKFITACISGGISLVAGYIISVALIFALFPDISEYSQEFQTILRESYNFNMSFLLLKCFGVFLYGFFSALPAIVLTSITRNKYLIICIPFFLKYATTQTCMKISAKAYSDFENVDETLGRIINILSPDSILKVFELQDKLYIFAYSIGLIIIAYVLYMFINRRRLDCGE